MDIECVFDLDHLGRQIAKGIRMAAAGAPRNPVPLNDLLAGILDPVLRRKAGVSLSLVQSWEEIVGPVAAARSRPEKMIWPRGKGGGHAFGQGTLVIACEASAALELQHETGEIIARVNAFFGAGAIGKVRLVQKPLPPERDTPRRAPRPLGEAEREAIRRMTALVEDPDLRAALQRLGETVKGSARTIKSP